MKFRQYHRPGTENWVPRDFCDFENITLVQSILQQNKINVKIGALTSQIRGGERAASERLTSFVTKGLANYKGKSTGKSSSTRPAVGSKLSQYLICGYISATTVVAAVLAWEQREMLQTKLPGSPVEHASDGLTEITKDGNPPLVRRVSGLRSERGYSARESVDAFLQTLARREVAYHLAFSLEDYGTYESVIPMWIQEWMLQRRENDFGASRTVSWPAEEWSLAKTSCSRWNAIMSTIRKSGYCPHDDRTFWAQVVIDWERNPEDAWNVLKRLNDWFFNDAGSCIGPVAIAATFGRWQSETKWNNSQMWRIGSRERKNNKPSSTSLYEVSVRSIFTERKSSTCRTSGTNFSAGCRIRSSKGCLSLGCAPQVSDSATAGWDGEEQEEWIE